MLYVLGDSNAVGTAEYLLGSFADQTNRVDATLAEKGRTTQWLAGELAKRVGTGLPRASAVFLFVGMNDVCDGGELAARILGLVYTLLLLTDAPVLVAPPFCVAGAGDPNGMCGARKEASRLLRARLKPQSRVTLVTVHCLVQGERAGELHDKFRTTKKHSTLLDPLHPSKWGYKTIATKVDALARGTASGMRERLPSAKARGATSATKRRRG